MEKYKEQAMKCYEEQVACFVCQRIFDCNDLNLLKDGDVVCNDCLPLEDD